MISKNVSSETCIRNRFHIVDFTIAGLFFFLVVSLENGLMQSLLFSRKQRFQLGFLAGLVAGIVASLLMVLFSLLLGTVSLPELLGSAITQFMPPAAFQALHEFFGPDAKRYLFYIILVGQCLVFALGGGLCNLLLSQSDY